MRRVRSGAARVWLGRGGGGSAGVPTTKNFFRLLLLISRFTPLLTVWFSQSVRYLGRNLNPTLLPVEGGGSFTPNKKDWPFV